MSATTRFTTTTFFLLLNLVFFMISTRTTSAFKTALVTGSTDGIGLTTAKNLASKGYNIILHGRSKKRIDNAVDIVSKFTKENSSYDDGTNKIFTVQSDISTVQGCKSLIRDVQTILKDNSLTLDVLMNNAGVFEEKHVITDDNLEMTFAVNVMAPFVITSQLLPELLSNNSNTDESNKKSRVVIASSISQCRSIDNWDDLHFMKRPYSTHRAYSESKLFDAMLSAEIASRVSAAGINTDRFTCNSLDPGTVNTKMLLAGWGPCGISVEDALDETWLCTSKDVDDITGGYFTWKSLSKKASNYSSSERKKMWGVLSEIDPESADMWENISQFCEHQ
eukprot:CAMPEP_0178956996 /NCGR_PEP_ID=MMETSP0789-20121207/10627_1 /TAXON_ID=3005 /ORGANISM="Rhizosolenia setigera, Strain CCMP 1694" /LENGTH=335 /DNA_ID=CAMNT_0020639113 /DNA_START=105 /DNA_END=1112 /DNA_ORIENTATION=+